MLKLSFNLSIAYTQAVLAVYYVFVVGQDLIVR